MRPWSSAFRIREVGEGDGSLTSKSRPRPRHFTSAPHPPVSPPYHPLQRCNLAEVEDKRSTSTRSRKSFLLNLDSRQSLPTQTLLNYDPDVQGLSAPTAITLAP